LSYINDIRLYKLVTYGTESEGYTHDGCYHNDDVYKVMFSTTIHLDDFIRTSPEGLFRKIITDFGGDPDEFEFEGEVGDDELYIKSTFWRWYCPGVTCEPWDIASEEGLDGWDNWEVDGAW